MATLDKAYRSQLENAVKKARGIAEAAARAALKQLGVGEAAPFAHLSEQERNLRRGLRIHGRQLGDALLDDKSQSMDRLIEEVAYEHWHRMLFARFLAENQLLMYPDPDEPCRSPSRSARNWPPTRARPVAGNWPPASPPSCCRRSFALTRRCSG